MKLILVSKIELEFNEDELTNLKDIDRNDYFKTGLVRMGEVDVCILDEDGNEFIDKDENYEMIMEIRKRILGEA